jgi:hypothetical protein
LVAEISCCAAAQLSGGTKFKPSTTVRAYSMPSTLRLCELSVGDLVGCFMPNSFAFHPFGPSRSEFMLLKRILSLCLASVRVVVSIVIVIGLFGYSIKWSIRYRYNTVKIAIKVQYSLSHPHGT